MVWDDPRDGALYAARVGLDGSLLDAEGILLGHHVAAFPEVTVRRGGGFELSWREGDALKRVTVGDAEGVRLGAR